ncbi:MAG: sugar phosphate isomerase/epimerase [Phycisphaerales bacterium]|nr:sugar phosphate isomerase/epimerase [Phycisphaerales bacterium]
MRRADLDCSGLDLWIPPDHFTDPVHTDRAVAAVTGAIDLAAELAALTSSAIVSTTPGRSTGVVSLALPKDVRSDVLGLLTERALSRSVRIADHARPMREAGDTDSDALGIGIDPAEVLSDGGDPVAETAKAGSRLVSARLTDVARAGMRGGGRIAAGTPAGRLDVLAYLVALATAGYSRPVVADLRGIPGQALAAEHAVDIMRGPP